MSSGIDYTLLAKVFLDASADVKKDKTKLATLLKKKESTFFGKSSKKVSKKNEESSEDDGEECNVYVVPDFGHKNGLVFCTEDDILPKEVRDAKISGNTKYLKSAGAASGTGQRLQFNKENESDVTSLLDDNNVKYKTITKKEFLSKFDSAKKEGSSKGASKGNGAKGKENSQKSWPLKVQNDGEGNAFIEPPLGAKGKTIKIFLGKIEDDNEDPSLSDVEAGENPDEEGEMFNFTEDKFADLKKVTTLDKKSLKELGILVVPSKKGKGKASSAAEVSDEESDEETSLSTSKSKGGKGKAKKAGKGKAKPETSDEGSEEESSSKKGSKAASAKKSKKSVKNEDSGEEDEDEAPAKGKKTPSKSKKPVEESDSESVSDD